LDSILGLSVQLVTRLLAESDLRVVQLRSGLAGGGVGSFILDHFGSLNEWLTVWVAWPIGMLLGNANGATESTLNSPSRSHKKSSTAVEVESVAIKRRIRRRPPWVDP